ncbi:MAG: DUF3298 domain-containing protein [Lachnospiraceae bacterium]|nr:DUF3298 domain-containing protein [Lachnospiraceae bacterium]
MLFKKCKRLFSFMLAAALAFSLTACGDSDDIVGLPEGMEDMSEEELAALVDAYENGELDEKAAGEKKEAGNSGGLAGALGKKTGQAGSVSVPKLGTRITSDYKYSSDHEKLLFTGSMQAPLVTSDCEKDFPELAKALKEASDKAFAAYEKDAADYTESAQEHYNDDPDFFKYGSYENHTSILLRRLDDMVLSFADGWSGFQGGAHGSYLETGHTYDVRTGEELSLTDVLPDVSGLNEVLQEKLLEKYDPSEFFDLEDALAHYDPELTEYREGTENSDYARPYTWWLSPLGIEFYFDEYALTSYADGSQTVVIGYDEYPRAFAAEYVPKEERSFIYDFNMSTDVFDITGDGEADSLRVSYDYDGTDQDYYNGITIFVNNEKRSFSEENLWIYRSSYRSHYIRLSDGRQYVYTEGFVGDDHREFFVFDLSDGEIKAVDSTYLDYAQSVLEEETDYNENMLTDPENMELERIFYLLSTFYGRRTYHIGSDGMPESDERYTVSNIIKNTLTSKRELTCDIVDEDGSVISSGETLASGETFFLLYTDGETYVDARLSDGRIARLHITDTEYPCYVDGVSAEDCFEELFYVG